MLELLDLYGKHPRDTVLAHAPEWVNVAHAAQALLLIVNAQESMTLRFFPTPADTAFERSVRTSQRLGTHPDWRGQGTAMSMTKEMKVPMPQRTMGSRQMPFKLWLEWESWDDGWDPDADYGNALVIFDSGEEVALNVWTYGSLPRILEETRQEGDSLGGAYLRPPDLLVARLDRSLLERVIADLIETDQFDEVASMAALNG